MVWRPGQGRTPKRMERGPSERREDPAGAAGSPRKSKRNTVPLRDSAPSRSLGCGGPLARTRGGAGVGCKVRMRRQSFHEMWPRTGEERLCRGRKGIRDRGGNRFGGGGDLSRVTGCGVLGSGPVVSRATVSAVVTCVGPGARLPGFASQLRRVPAA